jgi:hypothetical protein
MGGDLCEQRHVVEVIRRSSTVLHANVLGRTFAPPSIAAIQSNHFEATRRSAVGTKRPVDVALYEAASKRRLTTV